MRTSFILASILAIAACSQGGNTGDDGDDGDDTSTPDAPPGDHPDAPSGDPDAATVTGPTVVFTIVLENQDFADIVGSPNAPYINSLIAQGGLATNYQETGSPSLPNYLHMISGANQYFGLIDLDPTFWPFPVAADNLGTQLEAAGINWRSYQESMGQPCRLAAQGTYAPKHDPFLYFTDMQTGAGDLCAHRNVDYSQFPADLAAGTYRFMWLTPDMLNGGHDPVTDPAQGLRQADLWMSQEVPRILQSALYQERGVLLITWDEAEGRSGHSSTQIPLIILSPRIVAPGMQSSTGFTHASYLATVEDLLGLPRLATVTSTPSMMEFLAP